MSNAISRTPKPYNEPVLSYAPNSPERLAVEKELARQKSERSKIPLYINGERIFTETKDEVRCPHDHQTIVAEVSQANEDHIQSAVDGCLKARRQWARLPWEQRASVFLKAADLIANKYRARINAATMLGQGKTVHQAEIDASCELIDFLRFNVHFMMEILSEQPTSDNGMWNRSQARGLEGFVYAITPFNFTAIGANLPTAPALMGCSVLWKPAPTAMHASWVVMEILEEAGLPPGVINMVPGDPIKVSSIALHHEELSAVHFTGSTRTFNMIWHEIGTNINNYKHYPRIVGETGGKDFVFAHPSADLPTLATALVRGAFEYQGQKCSAASRAYIPESIWPELKKLLAERIEAIKVGDVSDFKNFMGAVIDERSFDKIEGYINGAKESKDASIIFGGECDKSKGYFVSPTVIEAKDPLYKTMIEEIFGPVLTLYVYEDSKIDETVKICNESTPYALTGSIFARDRQVINELTEALDEAAGNFYINDKPTGAVVGQQPFGGARASGTNDKAGSKLNLLRWVSMRTLKETFNPPVDFRYPYMD